MLGSAWCWGRCDTGVGVVLGSVWCCAIPSPLAILCCIQEWSWGEVRQRGCPRPRSPSCGGSGLCHAKRSILACMKWAFPSHISLPCRCLSKS